MTPEIVRYLASAEGERLLASAVSLPADRLTRLTRLRREVSAAVAAAVVDLLELRLRARRKFSSADRMFLTQEGLEQSTGERIARCRAERFPAGEPVLDACCGIGGDALALAGRGPVLAVECDPITAACARANLSALRPSDRTAVLCADVTTLDLTRLQRGGFRSALLDPSRRVDADRGGRRRARGGEEYTPPLSWLETLRAVFPALGVKVSPILEDETLARLGGAVEFFSDGGECKEAVLWYGEAADAMPTPLQPGQYCATILKAGGIVAALAPEPAERPALTAPQAWLYEPDPAVIRAGLIAQVAAQVGGAQLDPRIAYLTGERLQETPFATAYRILDSLPFHLKNLQVWLRRHHRRVEVVKRRGVPFEPEEMRSRLAHPSLEKCPPVILVLTRVQDRPTAILCDLN